MNRQEYFQLMEAATTPLFRKKSKHKGKKHKAHEKKETAAKEEMEEQEEKFGGKEVEESDQHISICNGFLVRLREGEYRGSIPTAGPAANSPNIKRGEPGRRVAPKAAEKKMGFKVSKLLRKVK